MVVVCRRGLQIGLWQQCAPHLPGKIVDSQGAAEVVPLDLIAIMFLQEQHLLCVLDAFSDDLEVKALGHADDGAGDGGVIRIECDIAHKRTIDFQLVYGQVFQVVEAGISRPEVVDGQVYPISFSSCNTESVTSALESSRLSVSSSSRY